MLKIRNATSSDVAWLLVMPNTPAYGFLEDTAYLITADTHAGARFYIDDVELHLSSHGSYRWQPSFYAGRVNAEVIETSGTSHLYWLDVSPTPKKSGDIQFAEMVAEIRLFDQALLGGTSAATMAFGREGEPGFYDDDILLSRLRAHGVAFLDSVDTIARSPHLSWSAEDQVIPLSRIRRLHPMALNDRRLAALASGSSVCGDALESIQLRSVTSSATFNTAANQTLLALLKRFRASIIRVREKVQALALKSPQEEQALRTERRLIDLDKLDIRVKKLILGRPFIEISAAGMTSSGLTQIASHPAYSKAYRIGCRALSTGIEGDEPSDMLHVNHSWGIYETWCYLTVLRCVQKVLGVSPIQTRAKAVSAQLAFKVEMPDGGSLEMLFQATFPSAKPWQSRTGWSISRQRVPDVVLIVKKDKITRSLILDAKWRSGRENVLEAMESAHIYHDSLRLDGATPKACLLLLPGTTSVPGLEQQSFIDLHGVGTISNFSVGGEGVERLKENLINWLLYDPKTQ